VRHLETSGDPSEKDAISKTEKIRDVLIPSYFFLPDVTIEFTKAQAYNYNTKCTMSG
jgi:hypothetical protein